MRHASCEAREEGEPAGELWGVVEWVGPVVREDPLDVRSLVQIDEPTEGETVTSPLTVSGEAAVFEATFRPLGIQPPIHRRRLDFFRKSFVFSTRKAEALLGFVPRMSFAEGSRGTAAWSSGQSAGRPRQARASG